MSTQKFCHFCKREIPWETRILRTETCPWCRSDLHVCLNCVYHDTSRHNECQIPNTDRVRERDRANHCTVFKFREGPIAEDKTKDEAMKKLEDLFKM